MATQDQLSEEQGQFGMAFAEPDKEPAAVNEDDVFGITPPASPDSAEGEGGANGDAPAVAVVIDAAPNGGEGTGENVEAAAPVSTDANMEGQAGEVAAGEGGEGLTTDTGGAPTEDAAFWKQKYQSLQGKYNKEVGGRGEGPAEVESGPGEPDGDEMSPDQAAETLAADFGDDFVKLIRAVARGEASAAAGESVGEMGKTVQDIIADIQDTKARLHFERIYDAHPDFVEIEESPEFKAYVSQHPELQKVCESGTAREVIAMIDDYKKATAAGGDAGGGEAPPPMDTDDAEGVRSTGLQLPSAPAAPPTDYLDAWNKA